MIEFEKILDFGLEVSLLRRQFPEFAREIDRLHFDVGKKHIPKCGHGSCDCQVLTFEEFHAQRNIFFGTTAANAGAVHSFPKKF